MDSGVSGDDYKFQGLYDADAGGRGGNLLIPSDHPHRSTRELSGWGLFVYNSQFVVEMLCGMG